METEKPFWQKTKVWYSILIFALVAGTLIPLVLMGKAEVTSEQIFDFAEWAFGFLIGAHGLQRGLGYIGRGLSGSKADPPKVMLEDQLGALDEEKEDKDVE